MALSDLEKLKALRNGIAIGAIAVSSATPAPASEKQPNELQIKMENTAPRDNTRVEAATLKLSPQDIRRAQAAHNIWKDPETEPIVIDPPAEDYQAEPLVKSAEQPAEMKTEEVREQPAPLQAPQFEGLMTAMQFSEPEIRKIQDDYISEAQQDRKFEYTSFIEDYEAFHKGLYEAQLYYDFDKRNKGRTISTEDMNRQREEIEKKIKTFNPRGKVINFDNYDLETIVSQDWNEDFMNEDIIAQAEMLHFADEKLALEQLSEKTERLSDLTIADLENPESPKAIGKEQKTLRREIKKDVAAMNKSFLKESKKVLDLFNHFAKFSEKAENGEVTFEFEKDRLPPASSMVISRSNISPEYDYLNSSYKKDVPASHIIVKKEDLKPMLDYLNASYKKAIKEYPHESLRPDVNETMNNVDRHIDNDLNHKISSLRGTTKEEPSADKPAPQLVQKQPIPKQFFSAAKNSR